MVTLADKDGWKVSFGGFVELDTFVDTTRSFYEVGGNRPIARGGTYQGDEGKTIFSIRNSRLAFDVVAPKTGDWMSRGYIEMDFLGYDPDPNSTTVVNSEAAFFTNPTLRIRQAYLEERNGSFKLLAGQYWTLFGWEPYYVSSTDSTPPVAGVIYERTPQVTALNDFSLATDSRLQAAISISRPTQRDSMIPNFDAGLARFGMGDDLGFPVQREILFHSP